MLSCGRRFAALYVSAGATALEECSLNRSECPTWALDGLNMAWFVFTANV